MTDERLDVLVKHSAPNSVSIWMPVHQAGPDIRQDPIRLKNLLTEAKEQLISLGMRPPDAEKHVSAVRQLADDGDFWRHQYSGLGILTAEGEQQMLRLPASPPQLVAVCEHFHLKPLFGALKQDIRYYVLELSENTVRLLRGNGADLVQLHLPRAPSNFAQFSRFDDPERHVEFHTGTGRHQPGGERPAVFHGQGSAADDSQEKRELTDYCRKIDDAVSKLLDDEKAPLLLAATEPLQGIFRQVSACRQLDERRIAGSPDEMDRDELGRQALELLAEDFADPIYAAADRYRQAEHADLVEDDLGAILRAASASAVDTLLVSGGEQCWGRFDAKRRTFDRHDSQQAGDEDLLNLAAILAHRGGAKVYAVGPEELPGGASAAATLRFRPDG